MKKNRLSKNTVAGITLIELIVVVGIVAVVSTVVTFNFSKFSTNVSVRNLAQDIALSIRKAQSYATSVQSYTSGGVTATAPAYGVIFSLAPTSPNEATPSQKRFILFADLNKNGVYENTSSTCGPPSPGNECVEGFGITTGDTISQLCTPSPGFGGCTSSTTQTVTAVFCRPSPDAAIFINTTSGTNCSGSISNMQIVVQSAKGLTQWIQLWNTGQISVQ